MIDFNSAFPSRESDPGTIQQREEFTTPQLPESKFPNCGDMVSHVRSCPKCQHSLGRSSFLIQQGQQQQQQQQEGQTMLKQDVMHLILYALVGIFALLLIGLVMQK